MDTGKSFQNKLNPKLYSDSIYYGKIEYSRIPKRMVQFLRLQLQAPIFFFFGSLFSYPLFHAPNTIESSDFSHVAFFFDLTLELSKSEYPEPETGLSVFSRFIKFGHQQSFGMALRTTS
jgi:hypothetical protein